MYMARTHMQMEVQALETLDTASGVNSSIWMKGSTLLITLSGMFSLSYWKSESRNLVGSFNSFLLASQYEGIFLPIFEGSSIILGFSSNIMQVASITSLTPAGGFCSAFTSTMSFLLRFFKLSTAFSRAGNASSKSLCASSAICFALSACSFASFSCCSTIFFVSSASRLSFVMTTIISSTSLAVAARTGCKSCSSFCMTSTWAAVLNSFCSPNSSRRFVSRISALFSPNNLMKVVSSSR
mmetsp:Transcript_5386/g.10045  ORF Transcript_5386/g.10045 Transcript_5386/m.10045 type:complete len:240 (-) Transcript_5386:176-895(-)